MRCILILAFMLSGCGSASKFFQQPDTGHDKEVDIDGFKEYVKLFKYEGSLRDAHVHIDDLIIEFKHIKQTETDSVILGQCWTGSEITPTIQIDSKYWEPMSDVKREILMMHELGHCVLHRDHRDDTMSINNTYVLSEYKYSHNRKSLLDERFDRSKFYSFSLTGETVHVCPH